MFGTIERICLKTRDLETRYGAPQTASCRAPGFSLLTALLWTFLLASVALLLHLRLSGQLVAAHDSERQLYSFLLAESGVEYARTILPHLDVNELLTGRDGRHQGTAAAEWRSPMPYRQAQVADPADWRPGSDDGLPFYGRRALLPGGYKATANGRFFLRFSNNPEEEPGRDLDKIVLVRSLGVAPGFLPDPAAPGFHNAVTLVEARLRQERVFDLSAPLTLFGDGGVFEFEGTSFLIDGGDQPAVAVVSFKRGGIGQDLRLALDPGQESRIRGEGANPSIADASREYRSNPVQTRVFEPDFWEAFQTHLPMFADSSKKAITYFPDGGVLGAKSYQGVVVAKGDLDARGAKIEGLLLHLGGGRLDLSKGTRVKGGVWMSNLDQFRGGLGAQPLHLRVADDASVIHDTKIITHALGKLPPTQLGWRILFPEMAR